MQVGASIVSLPSTLVADSTLTLAVGAGGLFAVLLVVAVIVINFGIIKK